MKTPHTFPVGSPPRWIRLVFTLGLVLTLGACATQRSPYDYAAFKQNRPASLLVLPPVNDAPDVKGTYGVLSQITLPLAEAGYYVIPVSLMDETFRQNGLNNAAEIHDVSALKFREIFGADAAVYIKIKSYGTSYAVISSATTVAVEGRIVDLRTGQQLWQGSASASSAESDSSSQGGIAELLIKALMNQIIGTVTDASFKYAGIASERLLFPRKDGVLYGPRSPSYQKD